MRTLVIDDDAGWRRMMARAVGGTVLSAETIAAALELAKTMQPTVIILDVILPDGIGWEAIPRFRRAAPHSEIIVMTALGRRCDAIRAVGEHGAFAYIEKSEALDTIVRTVRRAHAASVVSTIHAQTRAAGPARPVAARR